MGTGSDGLGVDDGRQLVLELERGLEQQVRDAVGFGLGEHVLPLVTVPRTRARDHEHTVHDVAGLHRADPEDRGFRSLLLGVALGLLDVRGLPGHDLGQMPQHHLAELGHERLRHLVGVDQVVAVAVDHGQGHVREVVGREVIGQSRELGEKNKHFFSTPFCDTVPLQAPRIALK